MSELRQKRVEELLAHELGKLILTGDIKDPRVNSFLSVTRVESAKDFSFAKVYISTFQDENELINAVAGLNNAAGFIQSVMAKKIHLRLTPKLQFIADLGVKEGFELGEKIKNLLGK